MVHNEELEKIQHHVKAALKTWDLEHATFQIAGWIKALYSYRRQLKELESRLKDVEHFVRKHTPIGPKGPPDFEPHEMTEEQIEAIKRAIEGAKLTTDVGSDLT